MKIIYLSEEVSEFLNQMKAQSDVLWIKEKITVPPAGNFDWLVSYGYRHILKPEFLKHFQGRALNLHISLLPWNRGSDPNFWSFFDGTPKGVSIHHLDEGMDTGDIIAQQEVSVPAGATLASSYNQLKSEIENLFWEVVWPQMKAGSLNRTSQVGKGSQHRKKDLDPVRHLLDLKGWDTPVIEIERAGVRWRGQPS